MRRNHFTSFLNLALLLFLIFNFGCGTTKSIVKKIKSEDPYLKKKIMVFPPIDLSGLPAGKAAQTTADLIEMLKQFPLLSIYTPPKGWALPEEIKKPRFGVAYYDPKIAEMAKNKNMNALLAAFLPPIEKSKGRAGIWPFRYDTEVYKLSIVINVMDATNGCLYLTEFSSKDVALSPDEIAGLTKDEILKQVVEEGMPEIMEHQAVAVIKELSSEPWTGRILDKRTGSLMINAGKDAGVLPGHIFTVYGPGESIHCNTGRTVQLLGEKIGQIKATSVMEEHTLAEPVKEGAFSEDQTIIFYPADNAN